MRIPDSPLPKNPRVLWSFQASIIILVLVIIKGRMPMLGKCLGSFEIIMNVFLSYKKGSIIILGGVFDYVPV